MRLLLQPVYCYSTHLLISFSAAPTLHTSDLFRLLWGAAAGAVLATGSTVAAAAARGVASFGPVAALERSEEFRECVGLSIVVFWLAFVYATQLTGAGGKAGGGPGHDGATDPRPPLRSPAEGLKKARAAATVAAAAATGGGLPGGLLTRVIAVGVPVVLAGVWWQWAAALKAGALDVPGHCNEMLG